MKKQLLSQEQKAITGGSTKDLTISLQKQSVFYMILGPKPAEVNMLTDLKRKNLCVV